MNLSVSVARIMYPESQWDEHGKAAHSFQSKDPFFNHHSPDGLGKMVIFYVHESVGFRKLTKVSPPMIANILMSPDPYTELARYIIDLNEYKSEKMKELRGAQNEPKC